MMKVPLLDLKAQYQSFKAEVRARIEEICEKQAFILGPPVEEMEQQLAIYCSVPHAVGVSSGTDALLMALMAAGIGQGDRVVTTPYSFFATAGTIARVGARPVFADIDPDTFNLDPVAFQNLMESMPTQDRKQVKAVIPVHLYGQCARMDKILDVAARYDLCVIEDAAQAIGSEFRGQRAGSMGDFGCFSFFPSKNLGAFGDAGLVTTRTTDADHLLRMLRMHGMHPKYYHQIVGGNFRLDALQAAVISVKLKYLDGWTAARQANAARYRSLFDAAGLGEKVRLPFVGPDRHIFNQFVIRVADRRDDLRAFLGEKGIGTEVYYPVPLHLQECFAGLGYRPGDFPNAEQAALQTLALPIYPELNPDQIAYVVEQIAAFCA